MTTGNRPFYGRVSGLIYCPRTDFRREQRRRRADRPEKTIDYWATLIVMVVLLLGIGMMLGYGWRVYQETPEPVRRVVVQPTGAEKRYFEERYSFHGIWICIEELGARYFERDGKWCKL